MSRDRGIRLQNALAAYLRQWWPAAESAGSGRNGSDVIGTPGIMWECKTATDFKRDFKPTQWVEQSRMHARLSELDGIPVPVVVYYPAGVGAENTGNTLAIMPLHVLMRLLIESDHTPVTPDMVTQLEKL